MSRVSILSRRSAYAAAVGFLLGAIVLGGVVKATQLEARPAGEEWVSSTVRDRGSGKVLNSSGVILFTCLSVVCAVRITLISS